MVGSHGLEVGCQTGESGGSVSITTAGNGIVSKIVRCVLN